ncbi:hypothetical protein TNCT_523751 [Trichonephila clavata]|uniref:Uncharacterized protein n=1 Tax=Trichonephila clavata TaxID=2740835 RepID=A0A8X6FBD9_TRICU|nr:hypothetical protein TNCT_523751 [Trichonephila clavata]
MKVTSRSHTSELRKRSEQELSIVKALLHTLGGSYLTVALISCPHPFKIRLSECDILFSQKIYLHSLNTIHHTTIRLCSGAHL